MDQTVSLLIQFENCPKSLISEWVLWIFSPKVLIFELRTSSFSAFISSRLSLFLIMFATCFFSWLNFDCSCVVFDQALSRVVKIRIKFKVNGPSGTKWLVSPSLRRPLFTRKFSISQNLFYNSSFMKFCLHSSLALTMFSVMIFSHFTKFINFFIHLHHFSISRSWVVF